MSTTEPNRLQGNASSLIEFIITDNWNAGNFETFVSDIHLQAATDKEIHHRGPLVRTDLEMQKLRNVTMKEIYDKAFMIRMNISKSFLERANGRLCRAYALSLFS